ncbi:MAG TPA: hypothetical protein VL122_10535 [Nitrospirota bacterium]|nr:hypothetical protein [Nitrospirota bacterium]
MANVKNIKINGYCDEVSEKLMSIKESIHLLQEDAKKVYSADSKRLEIYERHLCELADMVEWKLQLLMKSCPFEWKGTDREFDRVASVASTDEIAKSEFSGGYIGG